MKTSKEFLERLQNDESFAIAVNETAKKRLDAGEKDYKSLWKSIAEEHGYMFTDEELEERLKDLSGEMSDEELGKVAGGTTPILYVTSVLTVGASLVISVSYTTNTTDPPKNGGDPVLSGTE